MNKPILICFALILSLNCAYSQNMVFDWAKMYEAKGGENQIYNQFFTADSSHLFVAGRVLSRNNDFDPDSGAYYLAAPYYLNYHVSMFDLEGNHIWSTILGSTRGSSSLFKTKLRDIAVGKQKNLYVTGSFVDTLFYQSASGLQYITSKGYTDIFFGKMDTLGNFLWMKSYGGIYDDHAGALSVMNNGDVYLSGSYSDSVSFIADSAFEFASVYALFTLKLDSMGQAQWVYSTANPTTFPSFEVTSMSVDNEDGIYIGGNFFDYDGDSVNFQSAGSKAFVGNNKSSDGFLLRLDTAGSFQWVKAYASGATDYIDGLAYNTANNSLLISGRAGFDTLDFDSGTKADSLDFSPGLFGNYLLSISPKGQFHWLKQLFADNGAANDLTVHITTDSKGNIHGVGTFASQIDANPGSDRLLYAPSPGGASFSAYSLKLDSLGNYLWSHQYKTGYNGDYAYGIGKDPFDNIYIGLFDGTGSNPDTMSFGNIELVHQFGARQFAKLRACDAPCVRSVNDSSLVAMYQNVTYQWLDCNNNYAPVTGATNRTFTAPVSGNYSLAYTSYGCGTDTSSCFALHRYCRVTGDTTATIFEGQLPFEWYENMLTQAGTATHSFVSKAGCDSVVTLTLTVHPDATGDGISVFPNPTADDVTIQLPGLAQLVTCRMFDVFGRIVHQQDYKNVSRFQIHLPINAGMYFIECTIDGNERVVKKVIKE